MVQPIARERSIRDKFLIEFKMKQSTDFRFLRYPGGKSRLLPFLSNYLLPPEKIKGMFIEPFVGGGSVFFHLQPIKAVLSDINSELIDLYRGIRYKPEEVWKLFKSIPTGKKSYNQVRKLRPKELDLVITGGSDCHGDKFTSPWMGNVKVSTRILCKLWQRYLNQKEDFLDSKLHFDLY